MVKRLPAVRVDAAVTLLSKNARTLTLQRGEPSTEPDLPPPPPPPPYVEPHKPTPEEIAQRIWQHRHNLNLGATIFDHKISVVNWTDQESLVYYEAACGFDIGLLAGVGDFVHKGEEYSLFLMHSDFDTTLARRFASQWNLTIPDVSGSGNAVEGYYDHVATSPGGAIALVSGTCYNSAIAKWRGWFPPVVDTTPPYVPGEGTSNVQISYDGNIIQAIEDGGSMVVTKSGETVISDGGAEFALPADANSAQYHCICRVAKGTSGESRLVVAATKIIPNGDDCENGNSRLWIKNGSEVHAAEHTPTIGRIKAIAKNGVILGKGAIWRNGNSVALDTLVEDQKVSESSSLSRFTNLEGLAMNGGGAIVATADDALNPGIGKKTLLMLLPVEVEQQGYKSAEGIRFCRWLDAFQLDDFDSEFADKDRDRFRIRIPTIVSNLTKINIESTGLHGAVINGAIVGKTTDGNYEVDMKQENGAMVSTWILLVSDGDDDVNYNGKGTDDGDNDQTLLADFESKIIVSFPEFDNVEVEFSAQKAVGNITLDSVYLSPAGDVPQDMLDLITRQVTKMKEIYRQIGIRVAWASIEGDTIPQTMLDAVPNPDPTKPDLQAANLLIGSEIDAVRTQIRKWQVPDKHIRIGYVKATMQDTSNVLPIDVLGFTILGTDGIVVSLGSALARETLGVTAHEVGHAFGLDHVTPDHLLMKGPMYWHNGKRDSKRFEEGNFNTIRNKEAFYVPLQ